MSQFDIDYAAAIEAFNRDAGIQGGGNIFGGVDNWGYMDEANNGQYPSDGYDFPTDGPRDTSAIPSIPSAILGGILTAGHLGNLVPEMIASGQLSPEMEAILDTNDPDWRTPISQTGGPVNTSDVTQGGEVIGSINQDLISEAISNLPGSGDYPPIQTGGTSQTAEQTVEQPVEQPEQPSPPESVRPDESGTVGSQAGTVGDGSGQVPDAPVIGGNNNGGFNFPPWLRDIIIAGQGGDNSGTPAGGTPPFNPNGGDMPTGADNEQNGGGIDWAAILGGIFGGEQGGNNNANIFADLIGDVSGGNANSTSGDSTATGGNSSSEGGQGGSSDNALSNALSNIGNTVVNTAATDYAYDQVSDMQDDQQDFLTTQRNEDIDRFQPFYDVGVNNIAGAETAGQNNPELRDVFAGQNDINAQTNVRRQFGNSASFNQSLPEEIFAAPGASGDFDESTGTYRSTGTGQPPNANQGQTQGGAATPEDPSAEYTGARRMVGAPVAYREPSQDPMALALAASQNAGQDRNRIIMPGDQNYSVGAPVAYPEPSQDPIGDAERHMERKRAGAQQGPSSLDFSSLGGPNTDRLTYGDQAALQGGPQQYGQQSGLPSLGAGNRQVQAPNSNASYTAPQAGNRNDNLQNSTLNYQGPQAGNRAVNLGDSTAVNVNQANPYDPNDSALQHVMDQGTRAIDNSAAARGKLNSGGTALALQEFGQGAALNRARDIQAINSSQDSANLASQGQSFGQQTTNAGLTNQFNQQDFGNSLSSNQFNLGAQGQQFGQNASTAGFNNQVNQQGFNNGVSNAGLQLGAQGQNFGQGLASAGFTNNLNQQDLGNAQGIRGQLFGEDLSGSQFDLGQAQNNISNLFNQNNQNFGQNFDANNQNFSADQQNFNQLYQLLMGGQAAAGGQVAAGQNYLSPLSNLNASQTGLAGASANNRAGGLVDLLGGLF